jgi:Icc-related predicted phosphoesterase
MKIVALPDLHGDIDHLPILGHALSIVDLILLVGDFTNGGSASDAERIINLLRWFNPNMLAIPGNWDPPEVDVYLSQTGINLNQGHVILEGIAFIGMGAALPGPVPTPNEISESDFERFFDEAMFGLDVSIPEILVCHQPPYNTLNDLAQRNLHVGSKAVRAFIERRQPWICFSGHIHEGIGIDQIGQTKVINPGPLRQGSYAYAEVSSGGLQTLEIRNVGFRW